MNRKVKLFATCVSLLNLISCCNAYPSYQNIIPNGNRVPHPCKNDVIWSGLGHKRPDGGGQLNSFGMDLYKSKMNTGELWTKEVCEADSDGDGRTNGEELGDPSCQWDSTGNEQLLNSTVTHPGICDPVDNEKCKEKNDWLKCDKDDFNCAAVNDDPDIRKLTLRMPETKVQERGSRYMCTHFHVPLDRDYHVIAMNPSLDNKHIVHHIVLFGCDKKENHTKLNNPAECNSMEGPSYCSQLNVWAVGIQGECFPDQFGIHIGTHGYEHFMLQIHWHNYDSTPELTDSSGITLYYTPNLRPNKAAVMTMGQTEFSLKPGLEEIQIEGSCAGPCTKREFKGPIYIYSAFNHMHELGRRQKIEQYRKGKLINTITDQSDFSFRKTAVQIQQQPVEVLPGDELRTTCVYDTTSRNATTTFGRGTEHEMCFGFITFYPAENYPFKRQCYSWYKLPHCLINDISKLGAKAKKNPFLKLGIQSFMKFLIKKG